MPCMSHLPVEDPVLKYAEIAQFEQRNTADFQSLVYFVERFAPLKTKLEGSMDLLFDQYTDYQSLPDDIGDRFERIDQMWHHLGSLQGCDGLRFNLVFEVMKYILLLPHSNAEEERIFSMITKNKTKFRASLSNKTTLPSILSSKVNCFSDTNCYKFQPSKTLLESAKKAAMKYNTDHSGHGQSSRT